MQENKPSFFNHELYRSEWPTFIMRQTLGYSLADHLKHRRLSDKSYKPMLLITVSYNWCEDGKEKSFPRDHRMSSLDKPLEADR